MKGILKIAGTTILVLFISNFCHSQQALQKEITLTGQELYQSFNKTQQYAGMLKFEDTTRLKWNNLPIGLRARAGTSIGNMNNEQRKLVHRILSASLSSQGYLKATGIMHLDDLLNQFYDSLYYKKEIDDTTYGFVQSLLWSHRNYFFAFFGDPSKEPWGFKLEGHHLSVNFSFAGGQLAVTPFFIGTDPAEYPNTAYAGWRVLGQEEDLGLKLVRSFSEKEQKKVILSNKVPMDIITSAESGRSLVNYWGLKALDMNNQQKALIQLIIREYVFNMEYDKAQAEYDKIIKAGIDNIYFGWIGELDETKPHYFILNGPTFLVEFDNNGGPRGTANHIHTIWREKGNEYGEDLLKKHYDQKKH